MDDVPERAPSPKTIWIDLVEIEETENEYYPEAAPSPTQLWIELAEVDENENEYFPEAAPSPIQLRIELADTEETEDEYFPEAAPSPTQFWIDLVEIEDTEDECYPEAAPSPTQLWIELAEIDEAETEFVPEAAPSPIQLQINLVEIEAEDDYFPEAPPSPVQLWIDLQNEGGGLAPEVNPASSTAGMVPQQDTTSSPDAAQSPPLAHDTQLPATEMLSLISGDSPATEGEISSFIFRVTTRRTDPVEIRIENTRITFEECTELAAALQDLHDLKGLTLKGIFPSDSTPSTRRDENGKLHDLLRALLGREPPFSLTLSSIPLSQEIPEFFTKNRCLTTLVLDHTTFEGAAFRRLTSALVKSATDTATEGVAPHLQALTISHCNLNPSDSRALARIMPSFPQLTVAKFPDTKLGLASIMELVTALSKCPKIRVLDLSGNISVDESEVLTVADLPQLLEALAAALPSWPDLREMNLAGIPIVGNEGSNVLGLLSKGVNDDLETLHVSDIHGGEIFTALKAVVANLPRFRNLNISPSPRLSSEDIDQLRTLLSMNPHYAELVV